MTRKSRIARTNEPSKFGAYMISGLIILLMVVSVAGVALYAPQGGGAADYGEYAFEIDQERGIYVTEFEDEELRFNNLPYSTLSVPTNQEAINLLRISPVVVMTFDPTGDVQSLQFTEFVRFELAKQIRSYGAVTKPSETYPDLPVITCDNASMTNPVLEIRPAREPAINLDGGCITLEGNLTSLLLAKDALIYQYKGMILPEDLATIPVPGAYDDGEIEE